MVRKIKRIEDVIQRKTQEFGRLLLLNNTILELISV